MRIRFGAVCFLLFRKNLLLAAGSREHRAALPVF